MYSFIPAFTLRRNPYEDKRSLFPYSLQAHLEILYNLIEFLSHSRSHKDTPKFLTVLDMLVGKWWF